MEYVEKHSNYGAADIMDPDVKSGSNLLTSEM